MELIKTQHDFHTSVEKALDEINEKWRDYKGLIICGSHAPSDIAEKLKAIEHAREHGIPTLGICLGMQLMAIEYARNVKGIKDATSEEIGEGTPIISKLPRLHVGIDKVAGWWGTTDESHWHHYSLNPSRDVDFKADWDISWTDSIAEIMRLRSQSFFVGVQFHPEYQSSKDKPHPLLKQFIEICKA